jgi:predicted RNA-binding Zn-ribbon protein involved in translation (DUF1610 family)
MRKSGKCPKCGSSEIYRGRTSWYRTILYFSVFRNFAGLMDYCCAKCGFLESYCIDHLGREYIRKKWEKLTSIKLKKGKWG